MGSLNEVTHLLDQFVIHATADGIAFLHVDDVEEATRRSGVLQAIAEYVKENINDKS